MKTMNIAGRVGMTLAATALLGSLVFTQAADARGRKMDGKKDGFRQQESRGGRFDGGKEWGFGFFLGDLNLSDEQKTQMQEKYRESRLAGEETNLKLRFAKRDLGSAMREETVDQAKVDGLWADIAELRQTQAKARIEQLLELKSILTEEQLATLQARENEWQELQALRTEFRELLMASGETDLAKLQELQAKITEKELVLEKERAEKWAASKDEFAQNRGGRRGRKF